MSSAAPDITVVVVIDYDDERRPSWDELRCTLASLAAQAGVERAEVLLVDSPERLQALPRDLPALPSFRTIAAAGSSYAMSNAGVRAAQTTLVGLLDADCQPCAGWLQACVEAMRRYPEAGVVSGRTRYGGDSLLERAMGLLARSYVEGDAAGRTIHISNNNAVFRRDAFLQHPLPEDCSVFASNLQSEPMRRAGVEMRFEPRMEVIHAYDGWSTELEMRRGLGYGVLATRLASTETRYAGLVRLGLVSIPIAIAGRIMNSCRLAARNAASYGVRWFELPAVALLAIAACAMEAPGMLRAVRGQPAASSNYR